MAFTAFAKFSGIDGGSTDSQHPKWSEVLGFRWGVSGIRNSWEGSDRQGRVQVNDFSIVKELDNASPDLFTKCAVGEKVKEVTVEFVEKLPGKQNWQRRFMWYRFETCLITSVSPGGSSGDRPVEEVSVTFEKATYKQG